jgi:hypothetical protein
MNLSEWAALAVAGMTLIAGFATLVRWLVKHYLFELKTNGGSSIKDKIADIDNKTNKLESRIDEIYRMLLDKG